MTKEVCKHGNEFNKCQHCFEIVWGKVDKKTGKRKGSFGVIGYKTGGKW